MRSRRTFLATAVVVGCIVAALTLVPAMAVPPDMRKLVKSVNNEDGSIVIAYMQGKQTHTYYIDAMTTIQVDGSPAKFSKIRQYMEVADYVEWDIERVKYASERYACF